MTKTSILQVSTAGVWPVVLLGAELYCLLDWCLGVDNVALVRMPEVL